MFEGGKADLAKGLSPNFQVSHAFTLGTHKVPSGYHFGAVFANKKHFIQGLMDNQKNLQGKYHYNFTENFIGKLQMQVSSKSDQNMAQFEAEYLGSDYTLNAKAINPRISDGSGIFAFNYLQSLSQHFAVGCETVFQKNDDQSDFALTLAGRYATEQSITTLTIQQMAAIQASYFHKVSSSVELGTELQMLFVGPRKESIALAAAKFDYRQANIRTQLDSTGKLSIVLEEKVMPGLSFLISGELDHMNDKSKFGVGINMEN